MSENHDAAPVSVGRWSSPPRQPRKLFAPMRTRTATSSSNSKGLSLSPYNHASLDIGARLSVSLVIRIHSAAHEGR